MENTNKAQGSSLTMKGNWNEQSKELKKKYSNLTDSDLSFETGKEDELIGRVTARLGKDREQVIAIINDGQSKK
jgi:uncharacterized protein YjbJ (UPF0337 family)